MKAVVLTLLTLLTSCATINIPFYDGNVTVRSSNKVEIDWQKYKTIGVREIIVDGQISSNEQNEYYRKLIHDKLRANFPYLKIIQTENLDQTLKNSILNKANLKDPELYIDVAVYSQNSGYFKDAEIRKMTINTYISVSNSKTKEIVKTAGAGFISSILDAQSTSLDIAIKRLRKKDFWIEIPSIGKSSDPQLREAYNLIENNEYTKSEELFSAYTKGALNETQKKYGYYGLALVNFLQHKKNDAEKYLLTAVENGLKNEDAWLLNGRIGNIEDLKGSDYGRVKDF